jgi:hypothetical protein
MNSIDNKLNKSSNSLRNQHKSSNSSRKHDKKQDNLKVISINITPPTSRESDIDIDIDRYINNDIDIDMDKLSQRSEDFEPYTEGNIYLSIYLSVNNHSGSLLADRYIPADRYIQDMEEIKYNEGISIYVSNYYIDLSNYYIYQSIYLSI